MIDDNSKKEKMEKVTQWTQYINTHFKSYLIF